jgi:hypothetical protein
MPSKNKIKTKYFDCYAYQQVKYKNHLVMIVGYDTDNDILFIGTKSADKKFPFNRYNLTSKTAKFCVPNIREFYYTAIYSNDIGLGFLK